MFSSQSLFQIISHFFTGLFIWGLSCYSRNNRHAAIRANSAVSHSTILEETMRQVRAKFRCMQVTRDWSGITKIAFRPVVQKNGKNKENEAFWSATPAGEAELVFAGPAMDNRGKSFEPGDYYYIDMHKDPEGAWVLGMNTKRVGGGEVELYTRGGKHTAGYNEEGLRHGKLDMGFNDGHKVLIEIFGEVDEPWDVQFKWAEASDD